MLLSPLCPKCRTHLTCSQQNRSSLDLLKLSSLLLKLLNLPLALGIQLSYIYSKVGAVLTLSQNGQLISPKVSKLSLPSHG
jgi:hypothetical protein